MAGSDTHSIADSPVPDWVRRNGEIFRTSPTATHDVDLSKKSRRYFEGILADQRLQQANMQAAASGGGAAMARAELSQEDGQGSIDPPAFLPPASYYQDVRNHANIAATMLVTARRQVGFEPGLVGQELSSQQMMDFSNKFYKWIQELDNYWPYLDMRDSNTKALWFHSGDENLISRDVSDFVQSFQGSSDEVTQVWRQSLKGMVKGISAYVTQHGANVTAVTFQMDILDTSGKRDFIQPLTFGRTAQSDPPFGKYDSLLTSGMIYLVNSSAIIASADYFANNGVTIFGAKPYVDYVNSGH